MSDVRVNVDEAQCLGHQECTAVAPLLFAYDEERDVVRVVQDPVPPDLVAAANAAVSSCPVQALRVTSSHHD